MAAIHIIKTSFSPFSVSKSHLGSEFNCNGERKFTFRSRKFSSRILIGRRLKVSCKIQDGENKNNGIDFASRSLIFFSRRSIGCVSFCMNYDRSGYVLS